MTDRQPSIDDMEIKVDNPSHPVHHVEEDHSTYLRIAKWCAPKQRRQSFHMDDIAQWSSQRVIRWVTCSVDDEKNEDTLLKYAETIELLTLRYPHWSVAQKVDWAIARALSPEWFDDHLVTRMNNSMLISALLITVTAAFYFVPPHLDILSDITKSTLNLRIFFYLTGFSNILFMASIVCGVCFVENALSRAYCDSDKFILIIEQYAYKNISQVCSICGAIAFCVSLFVPMWRTYSEDDSGIMTAAGVLFIFFLLYTQAVTANGAAMEQMTRVKMFMVIVGDDGRLLPQYYPKGKVSLDELRALYT